MIFVALSSLACTILLTPLGAGGLYLIFRYASLASWRLLLSYLWGNFGYLLCLLPLLCLEDFRADFSLQVAGTVFLFYTVLFCPPSLLLILRLRWRLKAIEVDEC